MKRLIIFCLFIVLVAGSSFGAMTNTMDGRPTAYYWTGTPMKDTGLLFLRELETLVEAWTLEGTGGILTFANGLTIDNATNNAFEWNENSEDLVWTFAANAVNLSSTTGVVTVDFATIVPKSDQFLCDPVSAAVGTVEGTIYYDSDDNALKYRNDTTWISLTAGTGDNTLDDAYDQGGAGIGRTITVDSSAVAFTATDAANNTALIVTQQDTAAATAMQIVGSQATANAVGLDIDSQTTGRDIEGTGASFYVEGDGSIVGVDLNVTGAAGITLENGAAITNSVAGAFLFAEGGEDCSFTLNANTLTFGTSTLMDQIAFGVLDNLTGVDDIAFDATTTSGIAKASSAVGADFTIEMSGAVDASMILSSSGTASDALQITTTAGGMVISNGGAAGGEDIDLDANLASLIIHADEDVEDAVSITASAGGINITADGAAASDLDLVCTNGSANLSGGEAIANAVVISAGAGGVDITSAATFDIDLTATGGRVQVVATEGAANQFKVDAQGTVAGNAIVLETTSGGIQFLADGAGTGDITLDAEGLISLISAEAAADQFKVDAQGTIAGNAINLQTADGGILLNADGATGGDIELNAESIITLAATDDIQLTVTSGGAGEDLLFTQVGAFDASIILEAAGTGADAIGINASGTGGGIAVDTDDGAISIVADGAANGDITIDAQDKIILVSTDTDGTDSIYLHANGGVSEVVKIHADQGTSATSINILSDDGGVTVTAGADDAITLVAGTGGINLSTDIFKNFSLAVTDDTDDEVLTAAGSGGVYTNQADANNQVYTLPTAATGLVFTFCDVENGAGADLYIRAAAGDTINGGTANEYYACKTDAVGQSVTVIAISNAEWIVMSEVGTWANDDVPD